MATLPPTAIEIVSLDSGVPLDLVSNQITSATAPSIGNLLLPWMADGGSDEGVYVKFKVPSNYVGTPKILFAVLLDGAPSNGDDLAFGFRKRAVANNESGDGTFDAEQTYQNTDIGGTGDAFSNEDVLMNEIALTAGDYSPGEWVFGWFYIDASGTTYTGNVGLIGLDFSCTDS